MPCFVFWAAFCLQNFFREIDSDGNGTIDVDELEAAIKKFLKRKVDPAILNCIMGGHINFSDLVGGRGQF